MYSYLLETLQNIFDSKHAKKMALGFSLIEIAIVMTIILLFTGVSIPVYRRFTDEKNVQSDSSKIVALLELARQKAISNEIPQTLPPGCAAVTGYGVKFEAQFYGLEMICSNTTFTLSTFPLSPKVTLDLGAAEPLPRILRFEKQTGKADVSVLGYLDITLYNENSPKCMEIRVTPLGGIDENPVNCSN